MAARKETGALSLRSRPRRFLAIELLEDRRLLASDLADNVFAAFRGLIAEPSEEQSLRIRLSADNFTIPSGNTTVGFVVRPTGGSQLKADTVEIDPLQPGNAPTIKRQTGLAGGESLVLGKLKHGEYDITVGSLDGTRGAFELYIFLAGDVTGDLAVTTEDHDLLNRAVNGELTDIPFFAEADSDRDGQITGFDLARASENGGVSTTVRVLTVTTGLDPAYDTGVPGDNIVNQSPVNVVGLTQPGVSVALDVDGDGFDDGTAVAATPGGDYSLSAALAVGDNTLRVQATDSFGQSVSASTIITFDNLAPSVTATSPVAGAVLDGAGGDIPVEITFSKPMIGTSVLAALSVTGNATTSIVPLAPTYNDAANRLQFSLSQSLPDTDISVNIAASATDIAGNTLNGGAFTLQFTVIRETDPPVITAALANDTGRDLADAVTSDPAISGLVDDASPIASFLVGLDDMPLADFAEAVSSLGNDGSFHLSRANLEQLLATTFSDGPHALHFQATDIARNVSGIVTVDFLLDSTISPPTLGLSAGSMAAPSEPSTTNAAIVTLVGQAEPGAIVTLAVTGGQALVTATGQFQFQNIALAVGDNSFAVQAIDVAGNAASAQVVIHRNDAEGQLDPVLLWNRTALEAIRMDASAPPAATRNLAMLGVAIFDAISAVDGTPNYYVNLTPPAEMSLPAAVSGAAYRILDYAYPAQHAAFDAVLTDVLAEVSDGPVETSSVAFGSQVADAIIAFRENDGWDRFIDYVPGNSVGDWQPTAPMYDVALLPQWAELTPFAMSSQQQFRPGGPPALDSAEYAAAFEDVKQLGAAVRSTRTDDQSEIARFWADGPGTYTPPGHWNQIALHIAEQDGYSPAATARLMAQLNVALADAAIVAWDSKYAYELWRPADAIHRAAEDRNDQTASDSSWDSFVINPPFPEYVSGHSTFSGAAGEILTALIGDNVSFSTSSYGLPGVERAFSSFEAAADEAGRSRIYGGIHFEFSNQDGLAAGRSLAQFVLEKFDLGADTQAPVVIVESPDAGSVTNQAVTVTGRVLDNLSGVASLEYSLDGGSASLIAYDANGHFSMPIAIPVDGSADGEHVVEFIATDVAGNVSSPVAVAFTLDKTAPAISLEAPSDGGALNFDSRLAGVADPTNSSLAGLVYAFDGGAEVPILFDTDTGSFDSELDLGQLEIGSHTLSVTATDAAGNTATTSIAAYLADHIPFNVASILPTAGSDSVGSTFRPQVVFSRPVDKATLTSDNFYATDTTGAKLPASIVPASDGTFAWLFFQNPMPGASTITLHVDGDTILAAADGESLDADGDRIPGGRLNSQFTTVSLVPLPGTTLSGKVVGPGPDLKPMTYDDMRSGPDGMLHTPDDEFLHPIAGVRVFILGLEDQVVYTNDDGDFQFDAVPSGTIKLAIDGMTATNAPTGFYFPEMVMDLEIEVGRDNTVMGTMGSREEKAANRDRQEVYLPRIRSNILQDVSPSEVYAAPEK